MAVSIITSSIVAARLTAPPSLQAEGAKKFFMFMILFILLSFFS